MARAKSVLRAALSDSLVMTAVALVIMNDRYPVLCAKPLAHSAFITSLMPRHNYRRKALSVWLYKCRKHDRLGLRKLSKDTVNELSF